MKSYSALKRDLEKIAQRAVAKGVTPGLAVAVSVKGRIVTTVCAGRLSPNMSPVQIGTAYDVASVTKAVSTSLILAALVDEKKIALDDKASRFFPSGELSVDITVAHLAGHSAGLPAHVEFFCDLWKRQPSNPHAELVLMASRVKADAPPGIKAIYSDVGYVLLGAILEQVGNGRLDELFDKFVAKPLALSRSFFVTTKGGCPLTLDQVAPTEICTHRGLVHGQVHDENAHAGGGICGHAGLFSTAEEVARIGDAVCAATHDRGPLAGATLKQLLTTSASPNTTWRLGWDRPDAKLSVSHAGDLWPRVGVGHLGYTGTSLWLDPTSQTSMVILTNRVYFSRQPEPVKQLRRDLMDTAARGLRLAGT